MATLPVFARVFTLDADENENYFSVRLSDDYDDVAKDLTAIQASVDAIITATAVLSAAAVTRVEIMIDYANAGVGVPNEFSDNHNYVFNRLQDSVTLEKYSVGVHSPDMIAWDASQDGLMGPTWQVAFANLLAEIVHPETGNSLNFEYAQKRYSKQRRNLG